MVVVVAMIPMMDVILRRRIMIDTPKLLLMKTTEVVLLVAFDGCF